MNDLKRILIVDDDAELGDTIKDILLSNGYDAQWVGNGNDTLQLLDESSFDFVLLDLLLPDVSGIGILKKIVKVQPAAIVIMMSGHGSIKTALEATRLGAYDWLEKPFSIERVLLTIKHAAEKRMLQTENEMLLSEVKKKYEMVGVSKAMKNIFGIIDKVADQKSTVLITGESGTGKELVARAIHLNSNRVSSPFIKVNSAAIPETLIESELFGHKKGSFTHAMADKRGKFLQADGGTLFLDEIGDLSLNAQAKVLRAIEYGEIETVGAEKPVNVDVRILAATNKDLPEMISKSTFREDLFHRINLIEIDISPLRERVEDVLPLVEFFVDVYCRENNKAALQFSTDAQTVLQSHPWPGNVREVRNLVERLYIFKSSSIIMGHDIYDVMNHGKGQNRNGSESDFKDAKMTFEKNYIYNQLVKNNWNISQTAVDMNVARSLVYKKIEELGIVKVSSG
ncbi:sigma-54-dependent Fis family transcriptional regulator [bacterium]|nr:sigma-54-dependent Fis family transcriptional regulator [bacterium]